MKSYKMYVISSCPYCIKLIQSMIDQKQTFYIEFLDGKEELLKEKKEQYKHPTVPIVILRDGDKEELIGGCTETLRLLRKEK